MVRPRVLIADDHVNVLECVCGMLEGDYDIVAAVSDGLAAVDAAVVLHPDVVILDISMPVLSGLDAATRLLENGPAPRIVFLTVHEDPEFVEAARNVGAHGYVLKRSMAGDLLPAIRRVVGGGSAFPAIEDEVEGASPRADHEDPARAEDRRREKRLEPLKAPGTRPGSRR